LKRIDFILFYWLRNLSVDHGFWAKERAERLSEAVEKGWPDDDPRGRRSRDAPQSAALGNLIEMNPPAIVTCIIITSPQRVSVVGRLFYRSVFAASVELSIAYF